MNQAQLILRNIGAILFSQLVGNGLLFLVTIIIARYLGRDEFGQFAYVMSFVLLFQMLADPGVFLIMIREIAVDRPAMPSLFGAVKSLTWVLTGGVFLLVMAVNVVMHHGTPTILLAIAIMTLASMITIHALAYTSIFRATETLHIHAIIFIIHKLTLIVLIVAVISFKGGIAALVACYVLANIVLWLLLRQMVVHRFFRPHLRCDMLLWKKLLYDGIPTGGAMIIRQMSWQIDVVIISLLTTTAVAGIFAAAMKLVQVVVVLPQATAIPAFPSYSRWAARSSAELLHNFQRVLIFMFIISIPLVLVLTILAPHIIMAIYGTEFVEATGVLRILGFALLFLFPTTHYIFLFSALKRQSSIIVAAGSALLLNVVLDIILIPPFGATGAALSTLIAEIVLFIVGLMFLHGIEPGFSPFRPLGKFVPIGIILLLISMVLPTTGLLYSIGETILLIVIFMLLTLTFGIVTFSDVRDVRHMIVVRNGKNLQEQGNRENESH